MDSEARGSDHLLDDDVMQAAARLLREEADAELDEADEDMRPENTGINQQRKQLKEGRQDRNQKELLFGKTHKELLEIVKALQKQVEGLEGWKNPPMTETEAYTVNGLTGKDDWDTLFEWLALGAMVLQPPVRGNWGQMKCTT
ncbi:hypothetical protein ABBQ32_006346 [Trebouxia sp. C0010 RCD-2024]